MNINFPDSSSTVFWNEAVYFGITSLFNKNLSTSSNELEKVSFTYKSFGLIINVSYVDWFILNGLPWT